MQLCLGVSVRRLHENGEELEHFSNGIGEEKGDRLHQHVVHGGGQLEMQTFIFEYDRNLENLVAIIIWVIYPNKLMEEIFPKNSTLSGSSYIISLRKHIIDQR